MSPDCTRTNNIGDKITIERGGIWNDNIQGIVEEKQSGGGFQQIAGADVDVHNVSRSVKGNGVTNNKGWYDIDVNAANGDDVVVTAEWKSNRTHRVRGSCTVT